MLSARYYIERWHGFFINKDYGSSSFVGWWGWQEFHRINTDIVAITPKAMDGMSLVVFQIVTSSSIVDGGRGTATVVNNEHV